MLPRGLRPPLFDRTRGLVTPITLQKELCAFSATQTTHCISIPSQTICLQSKVDGKVYRLRNAQTLRPLGYVIVNSVFTIADLTLNKIRRQEISNCATSTRKLSKHTVKFSEYRFCSVSDAFKSAIEDRQ